MTFYLSQEPRERPPNPAPREDAGALEVLGAGWEAEEIQTDVRDRTRRTRQKVLDEIAEAVGWTSDQAPFSIVPRAVRAADLTQLTDQRSILAVAGRYAARDPGAYGRLPLSPEQIDAETNRRLQADFDEAQDVLGAGGSGAGVLEFGGRMGRAITDPTNLTLALFGGSGSLARIVGTEAAIGGLAEAMVLPRQYEQAERLDIPDPNALAQVATGAALGGTLAAGLTGAVRGFQYARGRRTLPAETVPPGLDPYEAAARVDEAEAALRESLPPPPPPPVADGDIAGLAGRIIGIESGGNAAAQSTTSSASGLGGFIDGTWLATVKRHRPDLAASRTDAQLLALKSDPVLGREMTEALTRDNRDALAAEGLPTDPGSVYLAHFLGSGGATQALRQQPGTPIAGFMSAAVMRANRNIRYGGKFFADFTTADLRRWAEVKMGQAVDPGGGYSASTRAGYTASDEIATPAGTRIGVAYEVVDAASLIPASGRLQPRDRTRAASDEQIAEIAARLDPARLMPGPEADRGAPIIGPDNIIESGNGRVRAIALAAERFPDRFDAYVAAVRQVAEIPEGVQTPVLIARRTSPLDEPAREAFVREANSSAIARMSATELAASDARALDDAVLDLYAPGQPLTSADNRTFARAMMERLPQAERAALFTADGAPNADGVRRLRQALFARAYEAPDLTRITAELEGGPLRGILEALSDTAPAWARLRGEIAAGRLAPELDATAALMDAVRLIAAARETAAASGGKLSVRGAIDDALAQGDMLEAADPLVAAFVSVFYRDNQARSSADVAETLNAYVDEAFTVGSTEASLFSDLAQPTPREVLDAVSRTERGAERPRTDRPREDVAEAGPAPRGSEPDADGRAAPRDGDPGAGGGAAGDAAGDAAGAAEPAARAGEPTTAGDATAPDLTAAGDNFADGAVTPAAIAADAAVVRELRARLEAEGDFEFATGAPGESISARQILDDLDADDDFAGVLAACTARGVP